tara:strand:+ start:5347 stop:5760 length:414 start_codon:yes stop_codon:yes gene_type:complete
MYIMGYSYLAAPYTHEDKTIMDLRYKCITQAAGKMMQSGEAIYSPITHLHPQRIEGNLNDWSFDDILDFDKEILQHANRLYVLMLPGWTESPGVREEIRFTNEHTPHSIPTYYWEAKDRVPEWPLKYLLERMEDVSV